jgi:hypothetical protein
LWETTERMRAFAGMLGRCSQGKLNQAQTTYMGATDYEHAQDT